MIRVIKIHVLIIIQLRFFHGITYNNLVRERHLWLNFKIIYVYFSNLMHFKVIVLWKYLYTQKCWLYKTSKQHEPNWRFRLHQTDYSHFFKYLTSIRSCSCWSPTMYNFIRIHTGNKPYICQICENRSNRISALNRHMLIITGDKPHLCKVCENYFLQSSDLKPHMLVHTGDKPQLCKVCQKQFS